MHKLLADFEKYLEIIAQQKILVLGDIMLDRYVWGKTNRVSEEAPVIVVDVERKDQRLGGAGNVVHNLCNLGAQVSIAGVIGNDFYGELVKTRLKDRNVNYEQMICSDDRPTTTKKRVIARGQQIVRIDYEDKSQVPSEIEEQLISNLKESISEYSAIIVSDYAKGSVTADLLKVLRSEIESKKIGLGSCPVMVDPKPSNRDLYHGLNIIKPNKKEAEQITGIEITDKKSAVTAAKKIKAELDIDVILLSLGSMGLLVLSDDYPEGLYSETFARGVFDVSGAGDALVSSFTALVAAGAGYEFAAKIANLAAANVISEVGTVPLDLKRVKDLVRQHD